MPKPYLRAGEKEGDRARRGASGALYPQSASAGSNSPLRGALSGTVLRSAALRAWSCATWSREPRQVRKEAAVNGVPGAPQPTGPEWPAFRARSVHNDLGCAITNAEKAL